MLRVFVPTLRVFRITYHENEVQFPRDSHALGIHFAIDSTNTSIMRVRWVSFHFWRQIPQKEQEDLIPCGRCFVKFILDNAAQRVRA